MKQNLIAIIVVILILIGGGYWYFSSTSGTQKPFAAVTPSSGSAAQTRFRTLMSELPVSFTTALFSNPAFHSLTSIAMPIASEPMGRLDPFAPLSATAATVATSSSGTQG